MQAFIQRDARNVRPLRVVSISKRHEEVRNTSKYSANAEDARKHKLIAR